MSHLTHHQAVFCSKQSAASLFAKWHFPLSKVPLCVTHSYAVYNAQHNFAPKRVWFHDVISPVFPHLIHFIIVLIPGPLHVFTPTETIRKQKET